MSKLVKLMLDKGVVGCRLDMSEPGDPNYTSEKFDINLGACKAIGLDFSKVTKSLIVTVLNPELAKIQGEGVATKKEVELRQFVPDISDDIDTVTALYTSIVSELD